MKILEAITRNLSKYAPLGALTFGLGVRKFYKESPMSLITNCEDDAQLSQQEKQNHLETTFHKEFREELTLTAAMECGLSSTAALTVYNLIRYSQNSSDLQHSESSSQSMRLK